MILLQIQETSPLKDITKNLKILLKNPKNIIKNSELCHCKGYY